MNESAHGRKPRINMLGKTGLHNRTELARWAIENQMA